jgi:flagellar biosynthesis protein FliQ
MMLVALGLLLGMAGLLWMLVIAIMQADQQIHRKGPRGGILSNRA